MPDNTVILEKELMINQALDHPVNLNGKGG